MWHQNPDRDGTMRQQPPVAIIKNARVTTTDQNPQLQLDALNDAGAVRVFTDHGASGSTANRPQLDACMDSLREGDVLTVWEARPARAHHPTRRPIRSWSNSEQPCSAEPMWR